MLWNVHFKKKRKGKKKFESHVPPLSFFLFNKQGLVFFSSFFKKTQRNKANVFSSETIIVVYITTCQDPIYKSYKKNNKSCVLSCPLFLQLVQTHHCSLTLELQLNIRAKQKINRVDWESCDRQPAQRHPTQRPSLLRDNQRPSPSQPDVDWQKLEMGSPPRCELKTDFESAWSQLVSNLRDKTGSTGLCTCKTSRDPGWSSSPERWRGRRWGRAERRGRAAPPCSLRRVELRGWHKTNASAHWQITDTCATITDL